MRRDQEAGMLEHCMGRLVEVKKEQVEQGEAQRSELLASGDTKVRKAIREALVQVAQAMECACCLEPLTPGSTVAFNCGHTFCNRATFVSSSQTARVSAGGCGT
jgi:hypothetical protein